MFVHDPLSGSFSKTSIKLLRRKYARMSANQDKVGLAFKIKSPVRYLGCTAQSHHEFGIWFPQSQ